MARVIDYAWGRPSIASLKAAGAVAVCRYLSWLPNGKCLSHAEADQLRAGGIDIVSNWESYGDWQHDYSGGYVRGAEHAREAQRQHLACGGPPARPIYFSTDFDATAAQLPTVADYYRGVASVIGLDRTGAYGGYRTIKYLFDRGVIRWGWQTYAWSGGQWDPRAQLRQVRNGVAIGGVDSDLNDTTTADFGQWGIGDSFMSELAPSEMEAFKKVLNVIGAAADGREATWDDKPIAFMQDLHTVKAAVKGAGGGLTDAQFAELRQAVTDAVITRMFGAK